MTDIVCRAPSPEDAAELAAMVNELCRHEGDPTGYFTEETAMADVIAPGAPVSGVVAEMDGEPVGYALWHFGYESAWAARGAYLADLYVRPEARRCGVGDALLRHVARAADADGGTFVWWTAHRVNARARRFYRDRAEEEDGVVAYALTHEKFRAMIS